MIEVMTPVSTPLPDIDVVQPFGPDDVALFDDLREVLSRHGALDRFGIVLLHQHFRLSPDERLVEFVDAERRVLTIRPVAATAASAVSAVQTQWRLDQPTPTLGCERWCYEDPATKKHLDTGHQKSDDDEDED
jgi:hypothetical protein